MFLYEFIDICIGIYKFGKKQKKNSLILATLVESIIWVLSYYIFLCVSSYQLQNYSYVHVVFLSLFYISFFIFFKYKMLIKLLKMQDFYIYIFCINAIASAVDFCQSKLPIRPLLLGNLCMRPASTFQCSSAS